MKENKRIFIISSICAFGSLILAAAIELELDRYIINLNVGHRDFVINVLLGLFCSSFLTIFISFTTYRIIRKNDLKEFYMKVLIFDKKLLVFSYEVCNYPKNKSFSEYLDKFHYKMHELEVSYSEIKLSLSKISLIKSKKNKKIMTCLNDIHSICQKMYCQLSPLTQLSQNMIEHPTNIEKWLREVLPYDNSAKELAEKINLLEMLIEMKFDD